MLVDPARHLFTVDEYDRMGEVGLLGPDRRFELVAGDIVEMSPIGSAHAGTVNHLNRWFGQRVGEGAVVTVQSPLRLSDLSEPEPDLMLLRPLEDLYRSRHPRPEDVLLLIEVSASTAGWDRRVKRPLYAAAGIGEMWIVDLSARVVEVATKPNPKGYGRVDLVAPDGFAVPGAFPDLRLPVADLFG